MNYYLSKSINGQFDQTIEYVTEALKGIGFGVLSTINVHHTLKEKLDIDFKPYTILGACNPHFANKALKLEDKLGVLLPCNVVVIDQGEGLIEVAAMDPLEVMKEINNPELVSIAQEVSERIKEMMRKL